MADKMSELLASMQGRTPSSQDDNDTQSKAAETESPSDNDAAPNVSEQQVKTPPKSPAKSAAKPRRAKATPGKAASSKQEQGVTKGTPMPQLAEKGELVQQRVYPPELAQWLEKLCDDGAKLFNCPKGALTGIVLGVARDHWDEVLDRLEEWHPVPDDEISQFIWSRMQERAQQHLEAKRTNSSEADGSED